MVAQPIVNQENVHCEENVSVYFGETDQGKGILEINENVLVWKNESKSLKFYYPSISLHAISRETSKFPHECIYCLVDAEPDTDSSGMETEERDPETPVSEVRFVPENKDSIQSMYNAITKCQELHPDPDEEFSEGEEEEAYYEEIAENDQVNLDGFYTANTNMDDIQMSEEGLQILQRLQENMVISSNSNSEQSDIMSSNQFADAEE